MHYEIMLIEYFLYNKIDMLTTSNVMDLYKKYDVHASKRFSQNFLIDQNVLNKIIKIINIKNKDIVEIGPGLGSLTKMLLSESKTVTSYEIDKDMVKVLKGEIHNDNFKLIEEDFLKASFDWKGKRTIIANIPYNITSDILFKLYNNTNKIDYAIIMMQKEVAERLTCNVGTKHYGKLTISTQYFADVKYQFTVSEQCFIPSPKVKSAIVLFKFKKVNNPDSFLKFIKQCFSMRRKTLFNNLKKIFDLEKSKNIININGLTFYTRPQEISFKKYVEIFNNLK